MLQGGSCQLYLTERTKPFNQKINFYPTPPNKRALFDISTLSGGEKTVAAMALLFSMIQVKKTPLMLLDEIDAFLDMENVNLVTDFLKRELKT